MAGQAAELPIFELPVVLLPGELLPLHIFEERYKRMIAHCVDEEEPFGVVFHDEEGGARRIGCEARVEQVLEQFDDGRMNIVVSGERPCRVLDRFAASEYPAGLCGARRAGVRRATRARRARRSGRL
jgi:Lon protease-like protein